jgi:hypothetical protein
MKKLLLITVLILHFQAHLTLKVLNGLKIKKNIQMPMDYFGIKKKDF